jgi:ParB family chromosome partitioning protein
LTLEIIYKIKNYKIKNYSKMPNNYGLGRGLASLIPKKANTRTDTDLTRTNTDDVLVNKDEKQPETEEGGRIIEADINVIVSNPHQPRIGFDEEKIKELAQSIKNHGIIQPLIVSRKGNNYELIAGERRLQAAKIAGLAKVPVIVRAAEEKEKLELAVVENVQRHDLNAIEEAKAYKKLYGEFQMSQEEIADVVGKSRSAVTNKMRLLGLPIEIQKALISGKISEGHAKSILALTNPEKQRALFELILKDNLTVRQVEDKTKEVSVRSHKRHVNIDPEIKELENKLMGALGTKVKVSKSGKGGRIVIEYYSEEELDNILNKIT